MSERNAPTLNDVARLAGVSTATVSRCLNAPERVIQRTRERVMAAVSELGYSPNFGARVMAAKRTHTIGAIIPTMENAIFARGLQAFQEELRAQGYTLLVASSSYRADLEEEQIRALISRGADGLLLIGQDRNPEVRGFLKAQNIPTLLSWIYDPLASQPTIGFDNRRSMATLAKEVLAQGHRRIGMISGRTDSNDRARSRVAGLRDAMAEAGLNPDGLMLVETSYGLEQGQQGLARLMAAETPPSVIMCGNDVLAVGAMKEAAALGLRIPHDLSITGFDDIELARLVTPELTTVHVPHRDMGARAARGLVDMVEGTRADPSEELVTTLCLRGSLGSVNRSTG